MQISLNGSVLGKLEECASREWLDTNGLGGWASGTLAGANTRRYHGLLVAATRPPVERMVLVSKLDETVLSGGARLELASNFFPGAVHPEGYRQLDTFRQELFPCFVYSCGDLLIEKSVMMLHRENTVIVRYKLLTPRAKASLELRPFVAARDCHALTRANDAIDRTAEFSDDTLRVSPYNGVPTVYISARGAQFTHSPDWYFRFHYPVERMRGFECEEDLFTYGTLTLPLSSRQAAYVVISTRNPAGRSAAKLFQTEEKRRAALTKQLKTDDPMAVALARAADQFIVDRGPHRSVIAGYHWFTDWGRDTMISLSGLCLVTGRHDEAREILRAFLKSISEGMVPNRFADTSGAAEYNNADATLWLFVAVLRYFEYTDDRAFAINEALPKLLEIVDLHHSGTRFDIKVDTDGLLSAGNPHTQLTWMDARVGAWVVTPRSGKPVEINALWYNALCITSFFLGLSGDQHGAAELRAEADRVAARFNEVFWNPAREALFDCADGDTRDGSLRPNQIFALSLPFSPLAPERREKVLRAVEEHLYTPYGLRTLEPRDPRYRGTYRGSPETRDASYHQGTVWPWLLGPFITALVRVRGENGLLKARAAVEPFRAHLLEAGIGSISEVFDGDPPHVPGGCIAQAWSVAELLRALIEDVLPAEKRNTGRRDPAGAPRAVSPSMP